MTTEQRLALFELRMEMLEHLVVCDFYRSVFPKDKDAQQEMNAYIDNLVKIDAATRKKDKPCLVDEVAEILLQNHENLKEFGRYHNIDPKGMDAEKKAWLEEIGAEKHGDGYIVATIGKTKYSFLNSKIELQKIDELKEEHAELSHIQKWVEARRSAQPEGVGA